MDRFLTFTWNNQGWLFTTLAVITIAAMRIAGKMGAKRGLIDARARREKAGEK